MADALQTRILATTPLVPDGTALAATNVSCDANNDGVGWVFSSPTTDAITHVGFRYGARTGTPPTYIIGLESPVVTTGLPDGTVLGGGSPASATFTPPADTSWDGLWQWVALANSYTPTRDQKLALTIRYSSGTVDASNFSSFTRTVSGAASNFPYALTLTAGTWAIFAFGSCFGIRTASGRFGPLWQSNYVTRSASTVGHRVAMKFNLPTGWGSTFKVAGVRMVASLANASGKAPILGLWNAGGVVQNSTQDSEFFSAVTNTARPLELYFDEATLTALDFGTDYYIGLEVADATSAGVVITGIQLSEANDLLAYPGGTSVHLATYNGSAWTDDQTVRPMVELILADITEPAGGGGGGLLAHPGMRGGFI